MGFSPAFRLKDGDDQMRSLTEYHGWHVALFLSCGCPWCHRCAAIWSQFQRSGVLSHDASQEHDSSQVPAISSSHHGRLPPQSIIVFSGDSASLREFAVQTGHDPKQTMLLPDPDMRVTTLYKVDPCPRVFVLDEQGRVGYTNNHKDDAPQHASKVVTTPRP
jgi:hypothetical protein